MSDLEFEPILVLKDQLYSGNSSFDLKITDSVGDQDESVLSLNNADDLPLQFQLRTIIIDSVKSGVGRDSTTDIFRKLINPIFQDLDVEFDYIQTQNESSVAEIALDLQNDTQEDLFVIFISGDTSISEFINELLPRDQTRKLYIANVAAGTGNALLSTLRILTPVESVANLFSFQILPLALNEVIFTNCSANLTVQDKIIKPITRQVFIAVFSWLFHSAIVADSDTPELRKLGLSRFGIAAKQNLEKLQDHPAVIINDDTTLTEQNHSYLVYTTLSNFEKNFKISPLANLQDLYLIEVGNEVQQLELLHVMKEAYKEGSHVDIDSVNYLKINHSSKLIIPQDIDESKLRFCLDGSIIKLHKTGSNKKIEIDIHKKIINGWDINLIKK